APLILQPLPAFGVRVVPQWRHVSGTREGCLARVSKNSQDYGRRVLASCNTTTEGLVQFAHKLCLIPGVNVLSHQLMQQLRRAADLRTVAAHVRQDDPRQYGLSAYGDIVDISAILAFGRPGVDPGCQFREFNRTLDTAV